MLWERLALLQGDQTEFTTRSAEGDLLAEPSPLCLKAMIPSGWTVCKKKANLPAP